MSTTITTSASTPLRRGFEAEQYRCRAKALIMKGYRKYQYGRVDAARLAARDIHIDFTVELVLIGLSQIDAGHFVLTGKPGPKPWFNDSETPTVYRYGAEAAR